MASKRLMSLASGLMGASMLLTACGADTPTQTAVPAAPTVMPTNAPMVPAATNTAAMAESTATTAMTAPTATTAMADTTATTAMTGPTATTAGAAGGATATVSGAGVMAPAGTFSWRAYAEPETFDPALMQENLSIDIGQNLYDSLVQFNPDTQQIEPALAESLPTVSPDGSVYTFKLRKDVKFSNGDPFTSADVVYSWNRVLNNPKAPYVFVMDDIKGATDVEASAVSTDTTKTKVTTASGIEAPDPYTVKVTLNNPSAYFLSESTVWTYYIVNQKVVGADSSFTETGKQLGAGTGAYVLKEWKHQQQILLERNPNYWGPEKPSVDVAVRILPETATAQAQYEAGQLDALDGPSPADLKRIQGDATLKNQLHSVGQARSVWIGLNLQHAPFGPKDDAKAMKLRQAIAQAIDRDQLVELALSGAAQPLTTLLPKGEPGYKEYEAYKFDPDAAKKSLADAGYPGGKGLSLTYTYRQRDAEQRVAEQLQSQLKENLGLTNDQIKIQAVDWKIMLNARQAHKYDMFYGSWGHDYPDPQNWLSANFQSKYIDKGNDTGYNDPQFDQLTSQGDKLADPAKVADRMALYNQAEKLLLDSAAIIPLYQTTRYWLVNPKWSGYDTNNSFVFPFRRVKLAK
ncbi:MAG: peptide ABC transporter substrate-binding protein [Chloroflexota bacterium]|nr:peptide ABC transporter substrate-binding protein [Chloroflexota bacterium]